jgi:hypothetical protein
MNANYNLIQILLASLTSDPAELVMRLVQKKQHWELFWVKEQSQLKTVFTHNEDGISLKHQSLDPCHKLCVTA